MSKPEQVSDDKNGHGVRGFYRSGCRCEICTEAGSKPIPHGTVAGYSNYRCRCDLCTAARRQSRKPKNHGTLYQYWAKGCRCDECTAAAKARPIKHGTRSTYENYGCRCELCCRGTNISRDDRLIVANRREETADDVRRQFLRLIPQIESMANYLGTLSVEDTAQAAAACSPDERRLLVKRILAASRNLNRTKHSLEIQIKLEKQEISSNGN